MDKCPICQRILILGSTIDEHHLMPKMYGGEETIVIHKVCHQKIHSLFTEKELKDKYFTVKLLLENEDIRNFVKWVRKKPNNFITKNISANRKRRKR